MCAMNGIKICATIEARMTSSRLPGKVLLPLAGKPSLQRIVERVGRSRYVDEVVVATTVNAQDDEIAVLCGRIGCGCYRGSEEDVLLRVLEAAKSVQADLIVEITGDCPVIDWRHIDSLIEKFMEQPCDYASNIGDCGFPVGFEVQVFPVKVLDRVNRLTANPVDHEHVSLYIYSHPELFRILYWKAEGDMRRPELEITLDTRQDYEFISQIYEELYIKNPDFSALEVVKLLDENPGLLSGNSNEGRLYVGDVIGRREAAEGKHDE